MELSSATPFPRLSVADQDDVYTIAAPFKDTARSMLINGAGTGSHWRMGVTDDAGLHGYYDLEFHKDFSGQWSLTKDNGEVIGGRFTYNVSHVKDFTQNKHFDLPLTYEHSDSTFGLIIWQPPGHRDSLMLVRASPTSSYHGTGYYPMLRQ